MTSPALPILPNIGPIIGTSKIAKPGAPAPLTTKKFLDVIGLLLNEEQILPRSLDTNQSGSLLAYLGAQSSTYIAPPVVLPFVLSLPKQGEDSAPVSSQAPARSKNAKQEEDAPASPTAPHPAAALQASIPAAILNWTPAPPPPPAITKTPAEAPQSASPAAIDLNQSPAQSALYGLAFAARVTPKQSARESESEPDHSIEPASSKSDAAVPHTEIVSSQPPQFGEAGFGKSTLQHPPAEPADNKNEELKRPEAASPEEPKAFPSSAALVQQDPGSKPRASTKEEVPPSTSPSLHEPAVSQKTEPVRDLSFKLGGGSHEQVEVKLQERAGEVRIAVHSSSPELTTGLRQQLSELVGRLDRSGYHAETWQPSAAPEAPASAQPGANQNQNLPEHQQQPRQAPFPKSRKTKQPQWIQEISSTETLEGKSHI